MVNQKKAPKTDTKMRRKLQKSFLESIIKQGHLPPDKLTEQAISDLISKIIKGHITLTYVIDHTSKLLASARQFVREKQFDYACFFYATFFEHKLNDFIRIAAEKKKIRKEHIKDMLKRSSIEIKLSWLPILLGLPPMRDDIVASIKTVANERNTFVHYKWNEESFDEGINQGAEMEVFKKAELAVKYIKRYENRVFYKNKKHVIKKFIPKK